MSRPALQLPVIQNWSCHNCGGCCREHWIEVTAEEKRRIERQQWSAADGLPDDRPVVQTVSKGRFRLAHQDDGACIFLAPDGLCRIHSRFGEAAKPLACRTYPYAFHPSGSDVTVSLRFSCPSVVQNLGRRVTEQRSELEQLSREIVPKSHRATAPPAIHGQQQLDWPDFHRFLTAFDEELTDDAVDLTTRLMRILSWLELVEQSQFDAVRGARLQDYLNLVCRAARTAQPDSDLPVLQPSRLGRIMFRQLVAQLLRHDTETTRRSGLIGRGRLLATGLRFTLGLGRLIQLPDPPSVARVFGTEPDSDLPTAATADSQPVTLPRFRDLEGAFGGRTPEIDRLLTRYFRVKLQGLHFCGPANFGLSLVDGFRSLALMYPATLWTARIRAASRGRRHLTLTDVQAALATLDHNYAYSPALGLPSSIRRLQILGRLQQVTRLCGWYSR